MEKIPFSQSLSDLYDMQKFLQEQQQEGMHLVGYGDISNIDKHDLHTFRDFGDILLGIVRNRDLPNPLNYMHIEDFRHELNQAVEKIEEKLMQPMDKLVQEINGNEWKMSPEAEQKYYEKVFQQDIQDQMGHDLGNVFTHLLREQQDGKEWVAYPDIEKVGKEDLRTFATREEALEYVAEKSNVAVVYDFNLIDRVAGALEPMVQEKIDKSFGQDDKGPDQDKSKDKSNDEELER